MFGFGKVTCVVCDQRVLRSEGLAVLDRKGFAVCRHCVDQWRTKGGVCPRCHAPLRSPQEAGIFLDGKRSFGHADCGASRLTAA